MNKKSIRYVAALGLLAIASPAFSQGQMPVPDISGAEIQSGAERVSGTPFGGEVEYTYTIVNPAGSTGNIWRMLVDVSALERGGVDGFPARTYPVQGGASTRPMRDIVDLLAPYSGEFGAEVVIVGQTAPSGWNGGVNKRGYAQFTSVDVSFAVPPGTTTSDFVISFSRPPTLRNAVIDPHWVLLVDEHGTVTDQELEDAFAVQQSISVGNVVLGPMDIEVGGFPHYSNLSTDIRRAEFLGWATDATLVNDLEASLGSARDNVFIGNNGLALADLQNMLTLLDNAAPGSFNPAFRDLVQLNVETLIALVPSAFNTFIPVFTATPESAELEIGETFDLTMRHFNSALEGNPPIENLRVLVRCFEDYECPNTAALDPGTDFRIDETGEAIFSYTGSVPGVDLIEVVENDFEAFRQLALVEVTWTAQRDLIVPAFVPPIIMAGEGDTILLTDRTSNIGNIGVDVPTVTTYYISDTSPVDIATATFLGEREVPPLGPGQFDDSVEVSFVIPQGFTGEFNYLAACADTTDVVVEADETNNCSFSEAFKEFEAVGFGDDGSMVLPSISVSSNSVIEGDSGTTDLNFAVTITQSDPSNDITVDFATADVTAVAGEDYTETQVEVLFPAGTAELTQQVTVPVTGDFDVETDETLNAVLSNASTNAVIGTDLAVGTITDDDLVGVAVGDLSQIEGDSGVSGFAFEVTIDQPDPVEAVSVSLTTADGSAIAGTDYEAAATTVVFPQATTQLSQFVTVNVIGDLDIESDETFELRIDSLSANAAQVDGVGVGTILNDDLPPELDCSTATASPGMLWPPNHKLVSIDISGVLDLAGDPAQIVVTGIEQDEPVNGEADGNTSPDGFGVGTATPEVRRERAGTGDGRIYFIAFDATDAATGAACSGTVSVGVPHDQGQGNEPVDSGVRFDSTQTVN